ncbi:MAG: hypothetical protein LBM99_03625, partial [Bacillales bacterium]|nr:hypothetical protein [Bacillales bacterium]
ENGESDWINDSSFSLSVKHLKAYKFASGGLDTTEIIDEKYAISTGTLEHGRIMVFFVSKNFVIRSFNKNNINLRLFSTSKTVSTIFDYGRLVQEIFSALAFYETKIGPFIYREEFDVMATGVNGFAMEYSGIVQEGYDFDTSWGGYETVAHESGHQFFYSTIGSNSYLDPFIDEGFTNFITTYWLGTSALESAKSTYKSYYSNYGPIIKNIGNSMEYFDTKDDFFTSLAIYYGTTVVLYEMLVKYGSSKIDALLKLIYDTFAFKSLNREGLLWCIEMSFSLEVRNTFSEVITTGYIPDMF